MQQAIPTSFNKYFWDVDRDKLSVAEHKTYIIERLLELGDLAELDWVNTNFRRDVILETLQHSRRLSPKTGNFFSLYYKVPRESLACMKKRFI